MNFVRFITALGLAFFYGLSPLGAQAPPAASGTSNPDGSQPSQASSQAANSARDRTSSKSLPAASTIKVDVNLVEVEASVRDKRGNSLSGLRREDFRIFEDGAEQQVRYFSHDELPLAIALVVDSSSSIAASLHDLRLGSMETLALLKPEDEVAVFSFTEKPQLVEALTTDRNAIAEDIAAISPWGGTNIEDALYDAAIYLGREAQGRRRAIVLVSDNEPSDRGAHDDKEIVRAALDAGTLIYSVKVGFFEHSRWYALTHPESQLGSVDKVCRQTGGEVIDSRVAGSIPAALNTVIARLKQGYTLAYSSSNPRQDGSFRKIEVRLVPSFGTPGKKYNVYARLGYYAPGAPANPPTH